MYIIGQRKIQDAEGNIHLMCMWINSQTIENLLSRDVIHLKGMVINVNEIQNIFDQSIIQYVGDIQELQTRRETPPVESQFKVAVQEGKIKTPNTEALHVIRKID